jgi:hypothetical protein
MSRRLNFAMDSPDDCEILTLDLPVNTESAAVGLKDADPEDRRSAQGR